MYALNLHVMSIYQQSWGKKKRQKSQEQVTGVVRPITERKIQASYTKIQKTHQEFVGTMDSSMAQLVPLSLIPEGQILYLAAIL